MLHDIALYKFTIDIDIDIDYSRNILMSIHIIELILL